MNARDDNVLLEQSVTVRCALCALLITAVSILAPRHLIRMIDRSAGRIARTHLARGHQIYNIDAYRVLSAWRTLQARNAYVDSGRCGLRVCVCAYAHSCFAARDKQRQCIVSVGPRDISSSRSFFTSRRLCLLLHHPGRFAVERRIRQEVKSESYFPSRRLFFPVPRRLGRPPSSLLFFLSPPPSPPLPLFHFYPLILSYLFYPRKGGITRQNCRMQTCKPQSLDSLTAKCSITARIEMSRLARFQNREMIFFLLSYKWNLYEIIIDEFRV